MAAARHLPTPETVQTITISPAGTPSPQGVIVPSGTQVEFINNSGSAVNITFNANPPGPKLFDNISNLANGTNITKTPLATNGSVNYTITKVGGATYGPFPIQVGLSNLGGGPLYIQVAFSNNQGVSNPDPAYIPVGGTLAMRSLDIHSYPVTWPGGTNPLPGLNNVPSGGGSTTYTANAPAGTYTYVLGTPGAKPSAAGGGGRVIIVSS